MVHVRRLPPTPSAGQFSPNETDRRCALGGSSAAILLGYPDQFPSFLGKSGNAGDISIQPHLHFEIRKNGAPIDPEGKLRR